MKHWTLVKLCVVLLHLAENVWCGTVIVPSLTYCAMMRAVWHLLCSFYMWRGLLMSPSLTRPGFGDALHLQDDDEVKIADGKPWEHILGTKRVSIWRPRPHPSEMEEERETTSLMEDAWQPGLLEEDARQPGLLEDDRLDVFIDARA